jgi:hypothetical protein
MAFDEPLKSEDLEALRSIVNDCRGLTPDIKAAIDDWVLGSGN